MTLLEAVSPSTKVGSLSMKQPIERRLAMALAAPLALKRRRRSRRTSRAFSSPTYSRTCSRASTKRVGAGNGNGVWRSLLTEEYAKSIAASGGIGIADQIQSQLISLQEKSQ